MISGLHLAAAGIGRRGKEGGPVRSVEELIRRVQARGGKVTPQRVLIYQALVNDTSHPTAEQLHARLRHVLPHLSLTTVYAALNDLAEAGELRRFEAGDGQVHYDPDTRPHAELVCVRCHRIEDAPAPYGRVALPERVSGFRILARTELLHGLCPECAAEVEAEEADGAAASRAEAAAAWEEGAAEPVPDPGADAPRAAAGGASAVGPAGAPAPRGRERG
jgi:Fur family peroxide stress response transcriptional regulator